MNQITWMNLYSIDNKAWRLHDKTIHLLFFVLLILNEQRYQTLNDNKKDDIDVDHKDTWKSITTTFLTLFHHPSLHQVLSAFSLFPLFSFQIFENWKQACFTNSHTFTHRPHTYYVVIYLQILDRTQMIRFITKA